MRKLAAIMFTDIAGYTALMSQDEEKALQLLQKNRALLKPIIEQFRGEWLKEIGDGTLSSFASAVDAVNCALVIQRTLKDDPELSLRMGIHIGDVVFERGDVFGDGVNVASRIEPLAEPGCICVTEQVYDAIRNKPGIEATFLGEKRLKGVDRPVNVYAVTETRAPLVETVQAAPRLVGPRWRAWAPFVTVAVAVAVVALFYLLRGPGQEAALGAKSIAVLPFANYSEEEGDWFSDGITEEIITHLSKIGDLKVISRTSAMRYKGSDKSLRQIGEELGVAAILEGSVRRVGGKVRITGQLIDARNDAHLWAESYNREEDLAEIFAIQSDVARQIASALKAALTPEEKDYIEQKPTDNLEAYEYYLRGNALLDVKSKKNLNNALGMYEKAVELDPTFAAAFARLTKAHLLIYWPSIGYDHTPERLAKAKSALDRALLLDPDHPEVHWAYGYYYYYGFLDYSPALEHFTLALQKQPNNSDIIAAIGYVQRRQGQWEAAAASMHKAAELDPRSASKSFNLASAYLKMRNWAEAERFADRCIFIAPENTKGYWYKADVYLRSKGDIEKARTVMEEALEKVDPGQLVGLRSNIEILGRDYQKALEIVGEARPGWYFWKALIYRRAGQQEKAVTYYDSARITYEEQVEKDPDSYAAHGNLGLAYAGLGRREDAIREGKLAVEIMPLSRDANIGTTTIWYLARIYTMLGEQDAAIDQLELLLSIPSGVSVPLLRLDPQWDPLREHPRFRGLVGGY